MSSRAPLPAALPSAFTVTEARANGVRGRRIFASDLEAAFWGVRVRKAQQATNSSTVPAHGTPVDDGVIRALLRALPPRTFLVGATAARMYRLPLPRTLEARSDVDIGVPRGTRAIRRKGVAGSSLEVSDGEVANVRGLRILTPARLWLDLAKSLTVSELVVAGDALIYWRRRMCTREDLELTVESHPRVPGVKIAREVVLLLNDRAESPAESRLRLILCRAGLTEFEINANIVDERGRFVARSDVVFPVFKVIVEYEGDQHRTDAAQWQRDITRRAELESLGYVYVRVTSADLRDEDVLVRRIVRHLLRRGWHPPRGSLAERVANF